MEHATSNANDADRSLQIATEIYGWRWWPVPRDRGGRKKGTFRMRRGGSKENVTTTYASAPPRPKLVHDYNKLL